MSKFVEERTYLEKLVERYERRIKINNKLLESVDNPLLDREKLVERLKHLEEKEYEEVCSNCNDYDDGTVYGSVW